MRTLKRLWYRRILMRCEVHGVKLMADPGRPHSDAYEYICQECRLENWTT